MNNLSTLQYDPVHDAQTDFRQLMNAMARPGKLEFISTETYSLPFGFSPGSTAIGLSLLNDDVTFYSDRNTEEVHSFILNNTESKPSDPVNANFLFLKGSQYNPLIEEAHPGDPEYPETSAFIVLDVEQISATSISGIHLELEGPGVKNSISVYIDGLDLKYLETLSQINSEYPIGIDTFIADTEGNIIGIPRTTQLNWKI